jgi:undecaprenyl diphosphate synthase
MTKRILIVVEGRVQGVGYRVSIKKLADKLQVKGYCENLKDGTVKIVAEGKHEDLEKILEFAKKGSFAANVKNLNFVWGEFKGEFNDFKVVRVEENLLNDQIQAGGNFIKSFFSKAKKNKIENDLEINWPKHVVIIPDGNRRWAKARSLLELAGHKKGLERIKEIIEYSKDTDIQSLTIWGFSTENWNRSHEEVTYLMDILKNVVLDLSKTCLEKKIVFKHLGRKDRLDKSILDIISDLENKTRVFLKEENYKNINLAFDYGGRDEILRAINSLPKDIVITEEIFNQHLDTNGIGDPDLIIRTSGEKRLSGILPWQGVYSELYFTDKHFPDFDVEEFKKALQDFSGRKRRFGK